jgi:suppressor for copper-sensitivity B
MYAQGGVAMRFRFILIVAALLMMPMQAWALQSEPQQAEFSTSRLMVASKDNATGIVSGIIELSLKEGWKTYWRSPGDAGFPFVAEPANTATNIASVQILWPYPKRFIEEWELEVFGFKDTLLLPVTLTLKDAAAETQVDLSISYAVCSDICINEQQELSLAIPADFDGDAQAQAWLDKANAKVPAANGGHGLQIENAIIDSEAEGKGVLAVNVTGTNPIRHADLFVESNTAGLRFPKAELMLEANKLSGTFLVPYEVSLPAKTLGDDTLRLTFVSNGKAVEASLKIAEPKKNAAPLVTRETESDGQMGTEINADGTLAEDDMPSFSTMLLLALLGGLVLNIMPCVLPVLSIKLLGAVKHGGKNTREVRQSFLASTAGILVFFLILAALTIAAKNAGHAVGWGFHFQSPEFLTFLTVLILLFAANMMEWFEIQLPDALNTHIYDVTNNGALKHRHHLLGDFATGAFAALMATPCSAPFLGTAVGFALSRGESEIVSIFFMLGLGLALPYLAAACVPSLATRLPKPGMWMVRVKQFMGVLLLAAALWLLWVIANQAHAAIAAGVLLLSALLGAVLHGGGRWRFLRRKTSVALISAGLLVALALLPSFHLSEHQDASGKKEQPAALWQPFNRAAIAPMVAAGKTVFVDVTADWCLTCKFNKLRVLDREPVVAALTTENVVAMRADMTRPMPDIQAYLKEYGRFGIPFNIVYSPANPQGKPLPELLDMQTVLQALEAKTDE